MIVREISVEQITPDTDQPRKFFDDTQMNELTASLKSLGQLQPAILYQTDFGYCLLDGHRRLLAATQLGWSQMHAIVLDSKPEPHEILRLQLTANCLRADLKPTELARSIQRLKDELGLSNTEVARYLSLSKSKVTQTLALNSLEPKIQQKVDAGDLAASTAYAIARTDPSKRGELVEAALEGRLKRKDVPTAVRSPTERQRKQRYAFRLPEADFTIAVNDSTELDELVELAKKLIRELRSASRHQLNSRLLEQVLATRQSRKPEDIESDSPVDSEVAK